MNSTALWFTAPYQVELRGEPLPAPAAGQLLVRAICSAISPGTEMLIYRGQFPPGLVVDETLAALEGALAYPLKYGYSMVGEVVALGAAVDARWLGQRVFAFQPHASHFITTPAEVWPVPPDLSAEEAVFLPNLETAVNFALDGAPLIGEQVAVVGQGVVGLLTTALLARYPLARLVTLDRYPLRRQWSVTLGAQVSFDPLAEDVLSTLRQHLNASAEYAGADLVYELSGVPEVLDVALATAGFNGRVVIGSWYGQKRAALDLGGRFHRARLRLISSQVSTLTPELLSRWTKRRRLNVAWEQVRLVQPTRLITHRFPFTEAAAAYQQIDQHPEETLQVILTF